MLRSGVIFIFSVEQFYKLKVERITQWLEIAIGINHIKHNHCTRVQLRFRHPNYHFVLFLSQKNQPSPPPATAWHQ